MNFTITVDPVLKFSVSCDNPDALEVISNQPVNVIVSVTKDGAQGIQGLKGDKGDTGDVGATGAQGIQGLKGDKGDTGDVGATGAQGIQGLKGDKGDTGDVGATGAQGIQGLKGDKGDKGDTGDVGPTGAQGIQGLKGDKGDKGDTGDVGATGAQGIQGLKGDKGDTGEQGIQGLKGDKGDTGEQGIQGLKGDKGDTGEQGVQGLKGDKGDTGESGAIETKASILAKLGWFIYKNTTPSSLVTGTSSETQVLKITIPPNSFSASDIIKITLQVSKTGTVSNCIIRLKLTTAATMPSGITSQIATFNITSTNLYMGFNREYSLNSGNIYGFPFAGNNTDSSNVNTGTIGSQSFDPTVTNYLYVSLTNSSGSDSSFLQSIMITNN